MYQMNLRPRTHKNHDIRLLLCSELILVYSLFVVVDRLSSRWVSNEGNGGGRLLQVGGRLKAGLW